MVIELALILLADGALGVQADVFAAAPVPGLE
jgi:hypothetical protein